MLDTELFGLAVLIGKSLFPNFFPCYFFFENGETTRDVVQHRLIFGGLLLLLELLLLPKRRRFVQPKDQRTRATHTVFEFSNGGDNSPKWAGSGQMVTNDRPVVVVLSIVSSFGK